MKNYFILAGLMLFMPVLLQAQSSPKSLAETFAQAFIENDTVTLFGLFPTHEEVMQYAQNQGLPMPPDEEMPAIKARTEEAFDEYKMQISELREVAEGEGYDWKLLKAGEILVKEQVEEFEDDDDGEASGNKIVYYSVAIQFKQGERDFEVFFGTFDVEELFKIAIYIESDIEGF